MSEPALLTPKLSEADERLRSPVRKVRMKEKLGRMPEGTFTYASFLEGTEKAEALEAFLDAFLLCARQPKSFAWGAKAGRALVSWVRASP